MNAALASLAERLEHTEYLVGDEYTLADCMSAIFVYWANRNNQLVPGTHPISPKMQAWFQKVSNRDGYKRTMDKRLTWGVDVYVEALGNKKK